MNEKESKINRLVKALEKWNNVNQNIKHKVAVEKKIRIKLKK